MSSLDSGVQALHEVAASLVAGGEANTQGVISKSLSAIDHRLDKLKRRAEVIATSTTHPFLNFNVFIVFFIKRRRRC